MRIVLFIVLLLCTLSCSKEDEDITGLVEYSIESDMPIVKVVYIDEHEQLITENISEKYWYVSFEGKVGDVLFVSGEVVEWPFHATTSIKFRGEQITATGCAGNTGGTCTANGVAK